MDIADILKQYADRPTDTQTDFDEVARGVPPDVLGGGIAQAFRSDQTPDFGDMVGSLFGGSNPQQRSGLLGQLIRSVAPAVLSGSPAARSAACSKAPGQAPRRPSRPPTWSTSRPTRCAKSLPRRRTTRASWTASAPITPSIPRS